MTYGPAGQVRSGQSQHLGPKCRVKPRRITSPAHREEKHKINQRSSQQLRKRHLTKRSYALYSTRQ